LISEFAGIKVNIDGDGMNINGKFYEVDINLISERINNNNYLYYTSRGGYVTIITDGVFKKNIILDIEQ
jgi:hypothetical protein